MSIFNLFSKRAKARRGEIPDVYQYDELPQPLRVQVVHIMRDALGDPNAYRSKTLEYHKYIHDTLCREYGIFTLSGNVIRNNDIYCTEVYNYFLGVTDIERTLDVIELGFQIIDTLGREPDFQRCSRPELCPDDAIKELNARMRYHGVGYQYESGELIRVDSQIIHQEAVKPALVALSESGFEGANEEFLKAFEHYRHAPRYKEAMNEALKSFESTIKVICQKNKWVFNPQDTASRLIDVCMANGLIPGYLQAHFTSLASGLKSGVPTVRNRESGHGQGESTTEVPSYLVSYHLHLTASSILMLATANKTLN